MSETNGMNINLGSLVQLGNLLSNLSQLNTLSQQGTNMSNIMGNAMGTIASATSADDSTNSSSHEPSKDNGVIRNIPGHRTQTTHPRSCVSATGTHVSRF